MSENTEDKCLEYDEKYRITDQEVILYFAEYGIVNIIELKQLEKSRRDDIIRAIQVINGVTIRQLSRITGISKSVIDRI